MAVEVQADVAVYVLHLDAHFFHISYTGQSNNVLLLLLVTFHPIFMFYTTL